MRDAAVFAEVDIPVVGFRIEAVLGEILQQDVEPLLALAAADDLADAGDEHVHGGDGFVVVVEAHVERFDFLRVVENGHGRLEMLFREPALVLGLQVESVFDRVFEGLAAGLEQLDRRGVGDPLEGPAGDEFEALAESLVHELFENRQVALAVFECFLDEVFHQRFGEIHVSLQIAERDFRLDHPELGGVARGVGILRAEGGAEGVDVGEGAGEGFAFELAADG